MSTEKGQGAVSETFTCESCGGTFLKGWSDEESGEEAEGLFPGIDPAEAGVVCDGCFERIMARARAEAPELIGPGWRGEAEASEDPIGDALRADAEAARGEIRAEGIICPSCGANMADLPDGHALVISGAEPRTAKCAGGTPVGLAVSSPMSDAEFGLWQAAASIALYDDFRRREAESFREIVGDGPANFTGLLGVLAGEDER